ncbi:MAG: hypothetical protein KC519_15620, partial [Anaerolineae bacterium]|nr:hypothetical protein [Anaerolineae bacterium]
MKYINRTIFLILLIVLAVSLVVPAAAQTTSASSVQNPNGTYFTPATYRTFENGFMIWASNNGTIYVFGNNGSVSSYA